MQLLTERYSTQSARWPKHGRGILAQFDADTIIVYQAYRPAIASYAVTNQRFGGGFGLSRMSWIKPSFLWMMYRSGWGTKEDQEVVLALHLRRAAFNAILSRAVHSTFQPDLYPSRKAWSMAVAESNVRLQWDPDHEPNGAPVSRRALQLGLRGPILRAFATEWLIMIQDISVLVSEQRRVLANSPEELVTPSEHVFPLEPLVAARIGADTHFEGHPYCGEE